MSDFTVLRTISTRQRYFYDVEAEVAAFKKTGEIISDACAVTIASWWHSPGEPNSTRLSTMGQIGIETEIHNFCNAKEYANLSDLDREEIDALEAYILVIQANYSIGE